MITAVLISITLFAVSFAAPDFDPDFDLKEEKRGFGECMACTVGLQSAITLFEQSSHFLLPELEHYCYAVTNLDARKLCLEFAKMHGESFLEIVAAMLDPKTFCGAVGAC